MHKNVWILTLAQAFMMSLNSLHVFVGGLIGNRIAPYEKLATMPVASITVGTALATIPMTMIMKRFGRKRTFLAVGIYSIVIALLAAYAISIKSFYFFIFCSFLLGVTSASLMQFRFASMESVDIDLIPKAASFVLLGGIVAAFIGPEVAVFGKNLFATEFAGSYVLLAGLFVIGFIILLFYENTIVTGSATNIPPRPLSEIVRQPVFRAAVFGATIGYAVMTFIMTATPVSMYVIDGHSLSDTKLVIQGHIVAMFLPSLITGTIIKKVGIPRVMIGGLIAYLICLGFAYSGHMLHNYWMSLVLLGVGWNFLFVGSTALLPQTYSAGERFKVQAFNEFFIVGTQAFVSLSSGWVVLTLGWEKLLLLTIPLIVVQLLAIRIWQVGVRRRTMRG